MLKRLFAAALGAAALCSSPSWATEPAESSEVVTSTPSVADTAPDDVSGLSALNYARSAAVADAVTTQIALNAGAVEANPLINTSPAGLLAMTVVKFGILEWADTFEPESRAFTLKATTALWGGVAVSNLLVAASAPAAVPVIAGAGAAVWLWGLTDERLQREATGARE